MDFIDIIYLLEVIIAAVALAVIAIIYFKGRNRNVPKYLGITAGVFVAVFAITFLFERPQMKFEEVQIVEVGPEAKAEIPLTTYHFKDVTDSVKIEGDVDYTKIGEYDIAYSVKTILGTYSKNAKIRVVDTVAPKIELYGGEEYKQSYSKIFGDPGYRITDNYDGDITSKVTVTKEEIDSTNFKLKYDVEDGSGNKTEKVRNVSIVDDIPPVLTLNGEETVTMYRNEFYQEMGAVAEDEKDGNLTNKIIIEGNVDTSKIGSYTITYKVSDNSGNESVKTRTVMIIENIYYNSEM